LAQQRTIGFTPALLPRIVTLRVSLPSQVAVSPPTIGQLNGAGGFLQAEVQFLGVIERRPARQRRRRDRRRGQARHRGAVRQVSVHRLAADLPGE
jgi:hypothetical protein